MDIVKAQNGSELKLALVGRLDTTTAPALEAEIKADLEKINMLILDFEKLEYISSAGLRVLLSTQKAINGRGKMVIKNVCSDIMEVFDITGFSDILTIE